MKKNEGAILKFVNISSDVISPNEMYEISSASTNISIPEIEEDKRLAELEIRKQMLRAILYK